jgi:signal transduction histidine kinase
LAALDASSSLTSPARPVSSRSVYALGAIAAILCALAVLEVLLAAPQEEALDRAVLEGLVVGVPMAVGLYALRSPHQTRFGWILLGTGAAWSLTALGESSDSLPYSIGRVAAWLVFPGLIYLMLAFPRGRIEGGFERGLFVGVDLLVAMLFIGSALFVAVYPHATPWATCRTDCPINALMVLDHEPAVMSAVVAPAREALSVALLAGVAWSLLDRMRRSSRLERRSTAPVLVMSVIWTVILVAYFPLRRFAPNSPAVEAVGVLWALCIPAVALAFLVGLMRRRLLVAVALQRLSVAVSDDPAPLRLRGALADALEDPELEVLLPGDGPGRWLNSRGAPTSTAAAGDTGSAVTRIDDGSTPLAALVHDRALHDDADLLAAVGSLVGSALRHERLKEGLAESLAQLADSRERIARVADLERSRIERDLHDGAQQRLIMLRVKLSLAEELLRTDAAAGTTALRALGEEIDLVLEELRSIAHGVYPSLLNDRGLEDALRSAVAGAPVPVDLSVRGVGRHRREIETAVYFTCLEALQNALKHARAHRISISLQQENALRLEVRDDGVGLDPAAGDGNGGLRHMRDRLEAVGGTLVVDSAPGHGTRILGTAPLESARGRALSSGTLRLHSRPVR